ncbi:MAG TPA: hypothetical protein VK126_01610, partial [Nitrososphaerales archaeon]|nr:hypothetical protein [Nitrososphaerales archaeon]
MNDSEGPSNAAREHSYLARAGTMTAMADPTVIAVLTVLHIASAIGWMGAVVFFLSVIGPSVRKFTPAASL